MRRTCDGIDPAPVAARWAAEEAGVSTGALTCLGLGFLTMGVWLATFLPALNATGSNHQGRTHRISYRDDVLPMRAVIFARHAE